MRFSNAYDRRKTPSEKTIVKTNSCRLRTKRNNLIIESFANQRVNVKAGQVQYSTCKYIVFRVCLSKVRSLENFSIVMIFTFGSNKTRREFVVICSQSPLYTYKILCLLGIKDRDSSSAVENGVSRASAPTG